MKEKYDLRENKIPSLHDQIISTFEWAEQTLQIRFAPFSFWNMGEKESPYSQFISCDLIFHNIEDADVFALVYFFENSEIKGKGYYLSEFVDYLKKNNYNIETICFLSGYNKMEIQGNILDPQKRQAASCIIHIYSENVLFSWKSTEETS